jgi:pantothenate kinase
LRPIVWERLTRSNLFLDQTDIPLEIDRAQVEQFYDPLATWLLSKSRPLPRLMVAVAGPPGSGKSAFGMLLVAVLNAEAEASVAALVGLDGWHYSNAYLETHFIERGGEQIPLRSIKGAPETFDAAAAYDCLSKMRLGGRVSFPVYSRKLHEPIPAGDTIDPVHRIVVVEGNYLLLEEEPWRRFRRLFDVRVFISANLETLLDGLRGRHLRGGKAPAQIERHIREVDLPNANRVVPSAWHAQVRVYKADTRRIDRIEPGSEALTFPPAWVPSGEAPSSLRGEGT